MYDLLLQFSETPTLLTFQKVHGTVRMKDPVARIVAVVPKGKSLAKPVQVRLNRVPTSFLACVTVRTWVTTSRTWLVVLGRSQQTARWRLRLVIGRAEPGRARNMSGPLFLLRATSEKKPGPNKIFSPDFLLRITQKLKKMFENLRLRSAVADFLAAFNGLPFGKVGKTVFREKQKTWS